MSIATDEPGLDENFRLARNLPIATIAVDGMNGDGRTSGDEFEEFCEDVRQHGVLTAILVREEESGFHLIAGHRRLAAAKRVGLVNIPAVVSTSGPEHDEELRLVENLHRRDLQPLEEAEGYSRLLGNGEVRDVARVAQRIGRSPRYVYDRLKLLSLTDDAKRLLREGRIELGHAIVLARLEQKDQQRALDPEERGGLFEHENTLFTDDERVEQQQSKDPWEGYKTRTAAELQAWVDQHVRAKPDELDPMLFPVTAEELGAAKKVIPITRSYHLQDSARAKERTFGPHAWKRADGEKGSKTCVYAATGFVVAGPGRNESFPICVAKEKCATHWAAEQKEKAKKQAERTRVEKSTASSGKEKESAARSQREREDARMKASREAGKRIEIALGDVAEKMTPEAFVRALALDAVDGGNFRWAMKEMDLEVKGDLADWVRKGPLGTIQRVLALSIADMGGQDSVARALGVDVKAIEKECEKEALDALKKKPKEEEPAASKPPPGERPRKRGAAKAKKAPKKSTKAKRGGR